MRVLVVGGTGLIGSKVVASLQEDGHDAMPASPSTGVDTISGEGLREALEGAGAVVDVTNARSTDAEAIMAFFTTSTRKLLETERAAGVGHHVLLSVVGTDRVPGSGYFRAKRAQEELIEASAVPYSIVRATQFFEFIDFIIDAATDGDTVRVPPALIQPAAADDVAAVVAGTATGPPLHRSIEVGGPERFTFEELARMRLAALGDARQAVADPGAGYFGAELEERALVPGDGAIVCPTRLEDWAAHCTSPVSRSANE